MISEKDFILMEVRELRAITKQAYASCFVNNISKLFEIPKQLKHFLQNPFIQCSWCFDFNNLNLTYENIAKIITNSKKKHTLKGENYKRNERKYIFYFPSTKNTEEKNIRKLKLRIQFRKLMKNKQRKGNQRINLSIPTF